MSKVYPITTFTHLDETFTPGEPVESDHPMVELRPDLFTTTKAKATTSKEQRP